MTLEKLINDLVCAMHELGKDAEVSILDTVMGLYNIQGVVISKDGSNEAALMVGNQKPIHPYKPKT